jgi:hypothetical protein
MSQEREVTPVGASSLDVPHSEPHAGHEGTRFEAVDARPGMVIWSLAIIAGMLVIVFALVVGIQKYLYDANPQGDLPSPLSPARVVPPDPQIQVHPWEELPDLRAHEEQVLNGYSKDPDGRVHIPISRAMDAIVSRLPTRPDTPTGITTPGGEGRDFSGSLQQMQAPYRQPKIKGEIRKHGQQ